MLYIKAFIFYTLLYFMLAIIFYNAVRFKKRKNMFEYFSNGFFVFAGTLLGGIFILVTVDYGKDASESLLIKLISGLLQMHSYQLTICAASKRPIYKFVNYLIFMTLDNYKHKT